MNQNISTDTLNLCRRLPSIERNNSQKLLQLQKTWQATDASLQEQLNYRPASRDESSSRKKNKQKIVLINEVKMATAQDIEMKQTNAGQQVSSARTQEKQPEQ